MSKLGSLFPEDIRPTAAPKTAGKPVTKGAAGAMLDSGVQHRVFVAEFVPGQEVEGIYLVQEATLRAAKNGSKYVQASFCDRTGMVPVRHWDATEVDFEFYKVGAYIRVRGRIETYQNRQQMIAFKVAGADPALVKAEDFLPVSKRALPEMEKEFEALLASFKDADYKRLIESLFGDEKVRVAYVQGPAATNLHHAWVHGLLEHVLSACQTADVVCQQRPFLNRDLLVAGVILHDIGKIEELDAGPGFNYTDTGRLLGHIVLGALLVERHLIKLKDFPRVKRDLILHLILSHHGEREYGSPVTPCTPEAVALHHIECMDAKVQGLRSLIEKEEAAGNTGLWTDFSRMVEGRVFKGS